MNTPQKLIILLTFLGSFLVGAVGGSFFFVDENSIDLDTSELTSQDIATPDSCPDGSWIDTHLHLETEAAHENIETRMDSNNVGCSLAFIYINPDDPLDSLEILQEDYTGDLARLIPFFFVTPKQPLDANVENIETVRADIPGFFLGHGELAFYREPFLQSSLFDENWQQLFKYSEENSFFLMIHLRSPQQITELEDVLTKYPNSKVLLHGPELNQELPELLQKYDNLYYTLDTATLLIEDRGMNQIPNVLMFDQGGKVNFESSLKERKEQLLSNAYNTWFPVVEAAPDQVMWGTDAAYDWHFDQEVYEELMNFSDDFVEMMPEEYRKGFMYQNAKRVFLKN